MSNLSGEAPKVQKDQVFEFVLNQMPTPSDQTSWQQIIDFKEDLNTKTKYYRLIDWVNQVAKENIPTTEFEDHYMHLYSEVF